MNKKLYKIIVPILLIGIITVVVLLYNNRNKGNTNLAELKFDISNIILDQGNAYISISKNDIEGYNRWVPFYFQLTTDKDFTIEEVESLLKEKIIQATLSIGEEEFYETKQLIWSAYKIGENTYNLTLVLIPDIGEFPIKGVQTIDTITLSSKEKKQEYSLPSYLIEERDTITEDELFVSLSSMESDVDEKLMAQVNYGITKNKNDIVKFELDFPKELNDIVDYNIINTNKKDDKNEYSVSIQLKDKDTKTVFRPFLKVSYDDGKSGWMIPSVPVYFN